MKATIIYMFLCHLTRPSSAHNCFTMVDSCPHTREKWIERSKEYNCTSGKFYTCLMTNNRTLAEACIYPVKIEPTRTGCPIFVLCTQDEPLIGSELKPCAEGELGCPRNNHTGYNLTDMFKYLGCLKQSSVEKENKTGILLKSTIPTPAGPPSADSRESGHSILKIAIPLTTILLLMGIYLLLVLRTRHDNDKAWRKKTAEGDTRLNRDSYQKVLEMEETKENNDTPDMSCAVQYNREEPPKRQRIPCHDKKKLTKDHNASLEIQCMNEGNSKSSSDMDCRSQTKTLHVQCHMDPDTNSPTPKSSKTSMDKEPPTRPSYQPIAASTMIEEAGSKQQARNTYDPLQGNCMLGEMQNEGDISFQVPHSSFQLSEKSRINSGQASPTHSLKSIPLTKIHHTKGSSLTCLCGASCSKDEPSKRPSIPYQENKMFTRNHNSKSSSNIDYTNQARKTASNVHSSVDSDPKSSTLESKTGEDKGPPTKPSSQPIEARTQIEEGRFNLPINRYQSRQGKCILTDMQTEEDISVQRSSSSIRLSKENGIIRSPASPNYSFATMSIPSEIMQYLNENNFKPDNSSLNVTTMKLLTKAPKAIRHVGRLHFIARLLCFQIGADTPEGKDLRKQASEFGEECNKCFEIAKDNFTDTKFILDNTIDRHRALSTLSTIMPEKPQEHSPDISEFIFSTSARIEQCADLCLQTEKTFKDLRGRLVLFDKSFQRAKKKFDEAKSVDNYLQSIRVTSALEKIRGLINETDNLFREFCNRWNNITDFFKGMNSFFTRQMKSDMDLYSRLSEVRTDCCNGGKSIVKSDKEQLRPIDIVLHKSHLNAKYIKMVTEFYIHVSREYLEDCLQQLSRSLYLEDQREVSEMESPMEKLQEMCVDAERNIVCLCEKIEQLINL